MAAALRIFFSIVVGIAIALALVIAVELVSSRFHPLPTDFNGSMEEMCKHVGEFPNWVLALVVIAWGATTTLSTWMTCWIGNRVSGLFVGLLLLAAVIFNISMLPYPLWFKSALLAVIPAAIYLGLYSPHRQHQQRVDP